MPTRLLFAQLALALAAGSAMAQDVHLYRADETVDPHDVAAVLDASGSNTPRIKMRSLKLLDESPVAQAPAAEQGAGTSAGPITTAIPGVAAPLRARTSSLALLVQFAFDSADILPAARTQLDALAAGIHLLPASQTVLIEGHTDAKGSARYNEELSRRRAQSVKRYLVAMHGIEPARLRTVGLGDYVPLPGRDRYAAENRRVQFRGE